MRPKARQQLQILRDKGLGKRKSWSVKNILSR
ncbi:MAG: hypothetical protein HY808_00990 [Nitrospirae bacterium]|nr:hypothetical protein [Nitrospirota bacterium]